MTNCLYYCFHNCIFRPVQSDKAKGEIAAGLGSANEVAGLVQKAWEDNYSTSFFGVFFKDILIGKMTDYAEIKRMSEPVAAPVQAVSAPAQSAEAEEDDVAYDLADKYGNSNEVETPSDLDTESESGEVVSRDGLTDTQETEDNRIRKQVPVTASVAFIGAPTASIADRISGIFRSIKQTCLWQTFQDLLRGWSCKNPEYAF